MTDRLEELRAKMDSLGEIVFWYGTVEEGAELLQLLNSQNTALADKAITARQLAFIVKLTSRTGAHPAERCSPLHDVWERRLRER